MAINVYPPSRTKLKEFPSRFALQRDDWNDYNFQTLYHLHYRHGTKPIDVTYIGSVKISRHGQTRADSSLMLADEFADLLGRIGNAGATELFRAALEPLFGDPSFTDLKYQTDRMLNSAREAKQVFLSWSTGHKIALHVLAAVVCNAKALPFATGSL